MENLVVAERTPEDRPIAAPQPAWQASVDRVIAERAGLAGPLLPILHGIQAALGHVPPAALPRVAKALNLSRAEVHGVVSYYHHFRTEPPTRHVLQVCRAESCQARGGERLLAPALERLGCTADPHRSADGAWAIEDVHCLGLCAVSPAVQIDDRLHGRVDAARLVALLDAVAASDSGGPVQAQEMPR